MRLLKISNLENSEIQKSDKELFIGFAAMQCIQKNNMEGTSGVSIFRKEVRSFYVGCLTYVGNTRHDSSFCEKLDTESVTKCVIIVGVQF
jgi:hypothetical protein